MKIKLRSDDPGPPGPTEWSEMNDWLANLREDADPEPAATVGPSSTAEPQSWTPSGPVPAPAEPQDGGTTGERPTAQSWGPSDSGTAPAQSWQPSDGQAPAQSWGPSDSGTTQGWRAAGDPAEPYAASQTFAMDEPHGGAALDEGDGFYGHYGDYDLDGGHPGPYETNAAEPDVAAEPSDTAVTDEPGVVDVASEPYGAPSAAATDLLETPDADVTGEAPVTGGSAGPVTPAVPSTFGASWTPVAPVAPTYAAGPVTPEAWMAPVTSGTPGAPAFAAAPVAPGVPAASAASGKCWGPDSSRSSRSCHCGSCAHRAGARRRRTDRGRPPDPDGLV